MPSWTGENCDTDICKSYCHNGGVCSLDSNGMPQCLCPREFPGTRCDGDTCSDFCAPGSSCQQIGTTMKCICSSSRFTGERCDEDRCDECTKLNQTCDFHSDTVKCISGSPTGHASTGSQSPQIAVAAVVPILLILLILLIMILIYFKRKQRSAGAFGHRRIETEEDDMEFGNPTFKYSRQVNDEDEEGAAMDAPFTIRDQKTRTNFTNPVYSSYLSQRGSESSSEAKKFLDTPHRDTERLLDEDDDD